MAVIENSSTSEGDVLTIRPEVPIVGLISLYQFIDTTVGETDTDYFSKQFRYSVDGGLTFSDWVELTLLNIQAVSITKYNQFVIEYQYVRIGDTPDVTLSFDDILVSGDIEDIYYPVFENTPFKQFFVINDLNVFGWALNVLEKLYRKGMILPDYIIRAENNNNLEDEDFIVYWNSITHFFSIIVYFARQFENFETNEILLQEFLKNKDLAFSDGNDLTDLIYIYNNYIAEYKKRGTIKIIEKKGEAGVDGELLRLINYTEFEEFIFCMFQNFETGWCLGKSSPMWSNTENIANIIKGYEFTKDVVDITKYPLINGSYVTLSDGYLVIDEVPATTVCGIGYDGDSAKRIVVNPYEDYEISFRVKQEELLSVISFGVRAYSVDGIELILKDKDNADSNYFIQNFSLKKVNEEYWVRAVLWGWNRNISLLGIPNIGTGGCLKMVDTTINSIVPIITVKRIGTPITTNTYIRDVKIKPLKLNFSRGQLGMHNILYLLFKNNNGALNLNQIKDHISNKLISYNLFLKTKSL